MEQGEALLQTPGAADEQQLHVGGQAEENVTHRKAIGQWVLSEFLDSDRDGILYNGTEWREKSICCL